MSANLTPPEGAHLTPDGYCYRCGAHPGRLADLGGAVAVAADRCYLLDHRVPGTCRALVVYPLDPAGLVDRAVLHVLQEELDLGVHGDGTMTWLAPALADRVLTLVAETVGVYTRGGAS